MLTLRPLLPVLLAVTLAALGPPATTAPAHAAGSGTDFGSDGIETARTGRQIAPGVRLESYDRLETDRWLRIDELVVDLGGSSGVRAEYLGGRGPATVADTAARHPAGPGRRVIAAVNGDFFDIRGTGAPLGPGIGAGRLLHSSTPGPGPAPAVGFGADGTGRVLRLGLGGSVTLPGGAVRGLAGYNAARPPAEGLVAYTADWPGTALPALGSAVTVRDGRVTAAVPPVAPPAPAERPEPGTTLLAATGAAAAVELAALRPGDAVAVAARPVPVAGPVPIAAVGGREALVVAGVPQNHDGAPNNTAAPRTAVGLSRDGRRLRILTVDGRQADSGGLTLTALGRLMHRLGAYEALNLDGGGSSTLLAALSGAKALALENSPSDGQLRPVPNGLVLTAPAGTGRTTGFRVEPAGGTTEELTRVFPRLTRTLTATGYDALLGPAPGAPLWSADGAGTVDSAGVFHAARSGSATAHAQRTTAHGTLRLEVLGRLIGVRPTPARIGLTAQGESTAFHLIGYDAQGTAAVVEPRDVTLDFDRSQWSVTDDRRGGFTVTALVPQAAGRLKATVRTTGAAKAGTAPGTTAELALGVGLETRPLAELADAAAWTGPGASPAAGHPGPGLALDLPGAGARGSAAPPRPLPVPELARSLTLWVDGDGSGARPAVELAAAGGTAVTVRGPAVDWTGWRELTLPLPATAELPLTVTRLSAVAGSGPGRLSLDTLGVRIPPTGPDPAPPVRDPIVATEAGIRARPWRFAVQPVGGGRAGTADPGADFVLTGARHPAFVHRGVRFLSLDTTRRTVAGGGLDRMRALRDALTVAACEPDTGALAVVRAYAPDTVDRKEAALTAHLLAEFRRTTGKRAALITIGAPAFAAGRADGVLSVAAPRTGRTAVGVDAFAPGDWLAVRQVC
ncbi:phosphodiester glycosidase family protein [Streptomyces sp. NPDC006430]|uniref:phosphodiester glycosidase family protein n=1 Tax=Streptomyces sp. NPDC006430 TaxID=3154299 RepID=UPI0033AEC992